MNKNHTKIIIEKETASDDNVVVCEINYNDGDFIDSGDEIGSVETSKAAFEIFAPTSGYIYYYVSLYDEIPVGSTFAIISQEKGFPPPKNPRDKQ